MRHDMGKGIERVAGNSSEVSGLEIDRQMD